MRDGRWQERERINKKRKRGERERRAKEGVKG